MEDTAMVKKHKNVKIIILSIVIMLLLPTTLTTISEENITQAAVTGIHSIIWIRINRE